MTFLHLEFHRLLYVGHSLNATGSLVNIAMSYCCTMQIRKYSFSTQSVHSERKDGIDFLKNNIHGIWSVYFYVNLISAQLAY